MLSAVAQKEDADVTYSFTAREGVEVGSVELKSDTAVYLDQTLQAKVSDN